MTITMILLFSADDISFPYNGCFLTGVLYNIYIFIRVSIYVCIVVVPISFKISK
jgi:hypothetical protein